ncbi:MAG: hypothetical protein COY47_03000, partial [Chloroflexi bacterium CG_4_10_14_0_8_um_filter_57_5]
RLGYAHANANEFSCPNGYVYAYNYHALTLFSQSQGGFVAPTSHAPPFDTYAFPDPVDRM